MNKTTRSILPALTAALLSLASLTRANPAWAEPGLPGLAGGANWPELAARGEISRSFTSSEAGLSLAPLLPAAEALRAEVDRLDPTLGVEVLMLIDTPLEGLHEPRGLLAIYNTLRSISTMEGIEYYSATRKRMRTLFEESYVVESPESRKRLPDPLVDQIPDRSRLTIHQKDLTTGRNTYAVDYRFDGTAVTMEIRNLEPMSYLFMPMVQPRDSLVSLVVIPHDGRVLLYGLSCMRSRSFLGLEKKKDESLYNRIKAISAWFREELIRRSADGGL